MRIAGGLLAAIHTRLEVLATESSRRPAPQLYHAAPSRLATFSYDMMNSSIRNKYSVMYRQQLWAPSPYCRLSKPAIAMGDHDQRPQAATWERASEMFQDAQLPLYEMKANLFKGLSHPYRIRVLEILNGAEEVSVAALLRETGLEASHLSQHLGVLRKYRLVRSERRGSVVYYQLSSSKVTELLQASRDLIGELLQITQEQLASVEALPKIATNR